MRPSLEESKPITKPQSNKAQRTPYQGALKCLGYFKCGCGKSWSSGHSWANTAQECLQCGTKNFPYRQRMMRKGKRRVASSKSHLSKLCEMCDKLGYSCKEINRLPSSASNGKKRPKRKSRSNAGLKSDGRESSVRITAQTELSLEALATGTQKNNSKKKKAPKSNKDLQSDDREWIVIEQNAKEPEELSAPIESAPESKSPKKSKRRRKTLKKRASKPETVVDKTQTSACGGQEEVPISTGTDDVKEGQKSTAPAQKPLKKRKKKKALTTVVIDTNDTIKKKKKKRGMTSLSKRQNLSCKSAEQAVHHTTKLGVSNPTVVVG